MPDLPPREFVRAVRDFCSAHGLIRCGSRIVVGVSGGPDSMALLRTLHELSGDLDLTLTVAHLDHGLRRTSPRDTQFVRRVAGALHLPFRTARVNVTRLATRNRISIEEAGRVARYAFFGRVAKATRARVVAVGHQQDDQAETILLRLIRGSSGSGLAGMAPARGLGHPRARHRRPVGAVSLIRPLLDRSRTEVDAYLRWRRIQSRTDPTNASPEFTRNRIRRELIPLLERRFNPRIKQALARAAQVLAEDDAALEQQAAAVRRPLRIAALASLPLTIRRRALRNAAIAAGGVVNRMTQAHLDALIRLVAKGAGAADLPGVVASIGRGVMSFRRRST